MIVFLNGRFVAEESARVSVLDRGFLYGDGLFETLRLFKGRPIAWEAHLQRLQRGAKFLQIRPPLTALEMRRVVDRLVAFNKLPDGVLRLTLTRGPGPRGYSPQGAESPTLVLALHPLPVLKKSGARLVTSTFRVTANDPLAQLKSCSKLLHVTARAEAGARDANDALLLNTRGHVAETTASNIFWFSDGVLSTPTARSGALMGITRAAVLELANKLRMPCMELDVAPAALKRASGVFLTNSVSGIVEAIALDGQALARSPFTTRLRKAYDLWVRADSVS